MFDTIRSGSRPDSHKVSPYPQGMDSSALTDTAALVALLRTRPEGLKWPEITAKVIEAGSAMDVWHEVLPAALVPHPEHEDALRAAVSEIMRWQSQGVECLSVLDSRYPGRLRGIHQAPPVLFFRGQLEPADIAVSVVGSRKASDRGLQIATEISRALVADGITVAAGLALGIDTAAHVAAIDAGGRTVAVIATGINRTYPAANAELHEHISRTGLLISQFWPDAPPQKHTFLMRNATMSGYGIATVVVEAGEHSGARAQARMAVEHGRPVVLTDLVVDRNVWARELVDRPGVHVASSLDEVMHVIRNLRADSDPLEDMLRGLLAV